MPSFGAGLLTPAETPDRRSPLLLSMPLAERDLRRALIVPYRRIPPARKSR